MQNNTDTKILKKKILKGVNKAVKKLIEQKKKSDGDLAISKEGKIIIIKANEM